MMNEETVATDQAALLDGKSRVSDACQGLLARMQKEIEAEADEDYWKAKFGLFSSEKPKPAESIVEVDNENRESREETVQERSTFLNEPTEDRKDQGDQETPLSSYSPGQSEKNLVGSAGKCEDASVASSKRSTGSIHSIVSKALSVTSKRSTASNKSCKPVPEIQLPPSIIHQQEEAETLTYNAPIAMNEETVDTTKLKQKQKRKSLMKSILKTLKNKKKDKNNKENKEKGLRMTEVAPVGEIVVVSPDLDPVVPAINETVLEKSDVLSMVQHALEISDEKPVVSGVQREEVKEVSLIEVVSEDECPVLRPEESTPTPVDAEVNGPASCEMVEGILDVSQATESVSLDSPVDAKVLFQDASTASAESSEAHPAEPEEPGQVLTTSQSHDSIERHRQKLITKLSTMEKIWQMTRSRSDDSSKASSSDTPKDIPRDPSKDNPIKGVKLPWFSLGASARNLLATETFDKDDTHKSHILPDKNEAQEPTATKSSTESNEPNNEATETLDDDTPSETLLPKRPETTEGCIEPMTSNEKAVAVMEGTNGTLTEVLQEKVEPPAETRLVADSKEAEAVVEKEEEVLAEKIASVGKSVETEINRDNQDSALKGKKENICELPTEAQSNNVGTLVVESKEISKDTMNTEIVDANAPVEASEAQPVLAENKEGPSVEKEKPKVKKTKTKKVKKTKKIKKKGKEMKNETKEDSTKDPKTDVKKETRKEKLEKLKFKLVENKKIMKAMAKMKASATTPVIRSKTEPSDARDDTKSTYLEAISEAVVSTNNPVENLNTEEDAGAVADQHNETEKETNLVQQAEHVPDRETESPPPAEPAPSGIVKSKGNPKKAPKKILSWSEDVRDNRESFDEFEIVDTFKDRAPSKPGDSEEVEAVIWWSASKEAVEVMCEIEDEEEKSVQSGQSSHGDSTYNTLGSDPTFVSEPDFSYSNFKIVTGEIFEEAVMIGEELTAAGQRMLPTSEIPGIPGISSFTSWFSVGTGKGADDTKDSKKKKKKSR